MSDLGSIVGTVAIVDTFVEPLDDVLDVELGDDATSSPTRDHTLSQDNIVGQTDTEVDETASLRVNERLADREFSKRTADRKQNKRPIYARGPQGERKYFDNVTAAVSYATYCVGHWTVKAYNMHVWPMSRVSRDQRYVVHKP